MSNNFVNFTEANRNRVSPLRVEVFEGQRFNERKVERVLPRTEATYEKTSLGIYIRGRYVDDARSVKDKRLEVN